MEKPFLLHMLTPTKNLSPFDANMAYDAGWSAVIPYTEIRVGEVQPLVQDVIFSRGPQGLGRTGIFVGGRDMDLAMDMIECARSAMVPRFEISIFADPSGAFTTAAALVATVEFHLSNAYNASLDGQRVMILGGTGPVGVCAAVLAARAGAKVLILGRQADRAERIAEHCNQRYACDVVGMRGEADDHKASLIPTIDVVFATAKAGVEVLDASLLLAARRLKIAADVNAVPPAGIAGVNAKDDGTSMAESVSGALGIGALTIGNLKYQVQRQLLMRMRKTEQPVYLHFEHALELARDQVGIKKRVGESPSSCVI